MPKTFQQFLKEDRIRRYIEYRASIDQISYDEAANRSMARLYKLSTKHEHGYSIALMTAFRGENPLMVNRIANRQLMNDIRGLGWGYTPVLGGFTEKVRDKDGNETGEQKKIDSEESFFCTDRTSNPRFKEQVLELLNKYGQEAAAIKVGDRAMLLFQNGMEKDIGKWSQNKLAEYYTKMKKGPPDRRFTFEAAGDASRTTEMAVDKFFEAQ